MKKEEKKERREEKKRKKERKKETDGRTDGRTDILMTSTYQKYGDALMSWTHLRRGRTFVDFKDVCTNVGSYP
jgi:hypothetical protein